MLYAPAVTNVDKLTFGRYEALFHIASGGMAEVFACRLRGPAGFEKLVAVKRLLPELNNSHFISMFHDEARLAAQISSPNVVQTLELGQSEEDDALYIVMELIVGVTLFDLCVSVVEGPLGKVPIPVVTEALAQAAHGMSDAHEATTPTGEPLHVVHRDISPQNILCGVDGRVRVTDFGIARAVSRSSSETQVGQLKGKVAYVSPEQGRGLPLDARSDVFSLGIVAWEALTGKSLFNTGDAAQTLDRVLNLPIPSPAVLRNDIPKPLADAVLWALQRDVDKRCPSAVRFERALREAAPQASRRELAEFIKQNGGPSLAAMKDQIRDVHEGRMPSVNRRVPKASGGTSRIFPEAELSSIRMFAPSDVPPPRERRADTYQVEPSRAASGRGQPLNEPPAGRQKRLRVATSVGIVAWVLALIAGYMAISTGPEPTQPPRIPASTGVPITAMSASPMSPATPMSSPGATPMSSPGATPMSSPGASASPMSSPGASTN